MQPLKINLQLLPCPHPCVSPVFLNCSIATVHPTWDLLSSILCSHQGLAPSILVQGQGSTLPHIVSVHI